MRLFLFVFCFNRTIFDIFITDKCFKCAFCALLCVLVLLRCFALIDSGMLEQMRDETDTQTQPESLVELGLASTVSTIVTQSSIEICNILHEYTPT